MDQVNLPSRSCIRLLKRYFILLLTSTYTSLVPRLSHLWTSNLSCLHMHVENLEIRRLNMGIFVTKAFSILCYDYNNQIVWNSLSPISSCGLQEKREYHHNEIIWKSNLYLIVRLHHRLHTEMVFDGTCVPVHLTFHGNVSTWLVEMTIPFYNVVISYQRACHEKFGPTRKWTPGPDISKYLDPQSRYFEIFGPPWN